MQDNSALIVQKFLMIERAIVDMYNILEQSSSVVRFIVPKTVTQGFKIDMDALRSDIRHMENTGEL